MEAILTENINELQLDRSKWEFVKFGDVAIQQKESVDRDSTELTRYIKGEHMSSEDIHLREWGELTDEYLGPAFIRKFNAGDILYGSRRTYLKKVAVAHFDGITSNTTFVVKANTDKIDQRLLPYVMLSEGFTEHSVRNSKGSVNPYINWKDIAGYQFLLPPKEQQAELAELLWSIDDMIEKRKEALRCLRINFMVEIENSVPSDFKESWTLGDIVKTRKGLTYKSSDYADKGDGLPLLNLKSIKNGGGFNRNGIKFYAGDYKDKHFAMGEDLLIACTDLTRAGNVVGYPLHPSVYQNKKMLFTMDLIAIEIINEQLLRDYLYYVLKAGWVHWFLFAHSPGTTVLHFDITGLYKLKIPKLNLETQRDIIRKLKLFEKTISNIEFNILNSQSLQKNLINQVF